MVVFFHVLTIRELCRVLGDLPGNPEIDRNGLRGLSGLSVDRGAARLSLGAGRALRVRGVEVTPRALEELQEVLLDGALTAVQVLVLRAGASEQAGHVLAQLLADLPVEAAVEEGV